MNNELFTYLIEQIKENLMLYEYDMKDGNTMDYSEDKGRICACSEILDKFFPTEWEAWKKENNFTLPALV